MDSTLLREEGIEWTHLWSEDVVSSPFLDVSLLAVVPEAVPERVSPAIVVEIGYVVG
jgi:hypothetical protein